MKHLHLILKLTINQRVYRSIFALFLIITIVQNKAMAYDHYDAVRAKTADSIDLVHPEWGFQDFEASTIYNVTTLTQQAIQDSINAASTNGGGTVIVAAGTVNITTGITMQDNVKVQGTLVSGARATTLNVTAGGYVAVFMCRGGENMAIENFIIDINNYSVHGINFWNDTINNFLICNNEIHSTPTSSSYSAFVLYFEPDNDFFNTNITIKHNYFHDLGMHCAGFRSARKTLVYSNTFVNSGGYGIDFSARCLEVEAAGNYIHSGSYGMKTYSSNYVYIHHNDINNVGTDAIALWVDPSCVSTVDGEVGAPMYMWIEHNNLSSNSGRAIDTWRSDYPNFKHLILRDNIVTSSIQSGSNIYLVNAERVDVYGDNGNIATANCDTLMYLYTLTVSSGTGSGDYEEDDVVNIAADSITGYEFDKWTGDTAYIADVYDATTAVTMPDTNVSVIATYRTPSTNVALNKTVIDSSGAEAANPAIGAIDGSTAIQDRWSVSGLQTDPQWMEIDLGNLYSVSSTELICGSDRAYQFTVDVKTHLDSSYTEVVDRSSNTTAGTESNPITDNFTATNARYVKITVTGAAVYTGDWCSLIEFRVFGDTIIVEAESGTLVSPMENVADTSTSGGYYIRSSTVNSGTATYTVNAPTNGTYKITGRVKTAINGESNSFFVQFDQQDEVSWHTVNTDGAWVEADAYLDWELTQLYEVQLTAGNHTLRLRGREINTNLDYFYLTKVETIPESAVSTAVKTLGNTAITVYPNPASTMLTVNGYYDFDQDAKLEVYNLLGRKVYETTQNLVFPHKVDISSLQPGNYILRIRSRDKVETVKFMKQ